MKFFAILFLLCGIVGFAVAETTWTTEASDAYSTSSASSVPANPCAGGSKAFCGKKLYFFY
ncbi:uncharacterized protein LOC119563464 [Drosophila subpulchrella]|uniref:uncharacterized protein LOC119563464 n=1 Tax=Drosophila subpulchrella TaxID=1486046 RepID=UPI0018A1723D|nr:uncharacterized protein LOC119563464 [Drosophila subpulchrella]